MRNLTIKRAKRFVACMGTMKVYIEDPLGNDLVINGSPCRKLGTLKNGEEKTFAISESAAKVFVIADKLSKGFCNEFYPLPEGQEDIVLTGKNCFNPAAGNPFRFDGVTDAEVLKNRKKGTRIGIVLLIAAFIVGIGLGFLLNRSQTFTIDNLEITLTEDFEEFYAPGYDAACQSNEVGVLILKESFSTVAGFGDYTLEEYGQLVLEANNESGPLKTHQGVTYFEYEYTNPENGITYHYITTLHKGPDAFWIVQFFTVKDDAKAYRSDIFDWAASVEFKE